MNKEEYINKLIDDAINSCDGMERAKPAPFLLTRINARMASVKAGAWDKAGSFISNPRVLVPGLCIILLVNALVIFIPNKNTSSGVTEQVSSTSPDEFSGSVTSIYETDNP